MQLTSLAAPIVVLLFIVLLIRQTRRRNRGLGRLGPGAAGAIYDMLNQDKRNAIELIVEERAAERTQEHEDDIVDDNEVIKSKQ